jgi:hypothetical protein
LMLAVAHSAHAEHERRGGAPGGACVHMHVDVGALRLRRGAVSLHPEEAGGLWAFKPNKPRGGN